jgi:hydrophobe/amphiphile efflux-3 (HAE3) family protein
MSERFIQLLLSQRWMILVVITVLTGLSAAAASRVNFDSSIESWFIESDPSLATYNTFTDIFGADQIVVVGVFAEDIFDSKILRAVQQISDQAGELQFVERVQSITNSAIVRRLGGTESDGFRERVLASPLQRATLLSADARATAVVIYYSRAGKTDRQKHEFVSGLRGIVRDATGKLDASVAITGGPLIGEAAKGRNADDMATIFPLMVLLIIVIMYVVFRKVPLTLLPLSVVAIAVTWAFGLMGLLGWNMSMISAILIPLILAVGVAHSIHIISGYRRNLERGIGADEAVQRSLTRLLKPCFFASLTTAIGLLSLLVSDVVPLQQFAVIAAAGVFAAFVVSIVFLPVMLQLLPVSEKSGAVLISKFVMPLLEAIHDFGRRYRRRILATAVVAAALFLWLASRVGVGLDPLLWIPHGDSIRVDAERIDESFGGGLSLEFLVSSPEAKLGTPAALRELEAFQAWLVANTTVVGTTSVADLVKEAARIARETGEAGYTLPRTSVVTDALLESMARDGELAHWLTADRRNARIFARIPLTSAQDIVDEIPLIRDHMRDDFADSDLGVQITGQAVLAGIMQTNMIDSQLYSFSVALAVVSLMMILLLRSLPLGMLAVVPNLLPIVVGLGAMALADIAFNPATVMIAAVALGIVVDDTVHMMTVFDREVRVGQQTPDAIRTTIMEVGRPVFVTSVLLAAGFALLVFGSFLPSRQIGGVIAVIVIAALATDLVVLPAILRETFSTSRTGG